MSVAELGGTGRPLLYMTGMDEATSNVLARALLEGVLRVYFIGTF